MNYNESIYTIEHLINILSIIEKKITLFYHNESNNSIGKQLGLFQDFKDLILEINLDKILFPDFSLQLKISPRDNWNGRGSKNRI